MTTNKPEAVIWTNEGNLRRVREMPHTGGKAKIKGREEQGFHVGLIRLSDYEALQAECEKLRAAIRRLCNIYVVDDYYMGQLREERLEAAVNRAIEQVKETTK